MSVYYGEAQGGLQVSIITCLVLTNNGVNKMPQTDDLKDKMTTVNHVDRIGLRLPLHFGEIGLKKEKEIHLN